MNEAEYVSVVGMFDDPVAARAAIERVHGANLSVGDVSLVERDPSRYEATADYTLTEPQYRTYSTEEFGDETKGGLIVGSLVGGTLGTLAGLGALFIPGIGPVLAAGPLIGALVGGTTGAITGTLTGALIDAFQVPEEHATIYRERLTRGHTMVAVYVDPADAAIARDLLRDAGAERFEWPVGAATESRYHWV